MNSSYQDHETPGAALIMRPQLVLFGIAALVALIVAPSCSLFSTFEPLPPEQDLLLTTSPEWGARSRTLKSCRAGEGEMTFRGDRRDYEACEHAVQFHDVSPSNQVSYERSDATITVRSRWTTEHLWILYDVQGDEIQFTSDDGPAWSCDALDIYLDPYNDSAMNYVQDNARRDDRHIAYNLSAKIAGFGVQIEEKVDGSRVATPESSPGAEESIQGAQRLDPDESPTSYTLEVRVTWDWLLGDGIVPPEGKQMGALFAFMDCDRAICRTSRKKDDCRFNLFSWVIGMDEDFATRADQWGGHLELAAAPRL